MGEKKELACRYIAQGLKRDVVLIVCGISRHQYYYRAKSRKRGRLPSRITMKIDDKGMLVAYTNNEVVDHIKEVQEDPDTDYGYRKMAMELAHIGFIINHKKVYRLMKMEDLLKDRCKKKAKEYAQYRIVTPERPLHVLEVDIKMVWVAQDRRHAYILTIIDTFTRVVLHWTMGYRMGSIQVKAAWEHVITAHLQPADLLSEKLHVEVRNDNGPQFSSNDTRSFLSENHISQVFTHPYTPQENGHIESFHSILKKAIEKQVFWSFGQLEQRLILFYEKYNNKRLHASLAYLWPQKFWELWNEGKIERVELSKKKVRFKLLIPRYGISGNMSLREVPCLKSNSLNGNEILQKPEMYGPETFLTYDEQHRCKIHLQSSPAGSKIEHENAVLQ